MTPPQAPPEIETPKGRARAAFACGYHFGYEAALTIERKLQARSERASRDLTSSVRARRVVSLASASPARLAYPCLSNTRSYRISGARDTEIGGA